MSVLVETVKNILSFFGVSGLVWFLGLHPRLLILIMGMLILLSAFLGKEGNRRLLVLYLAGILYVTILSRPWGKRSAILTPFWSYRYFLKDEYFTREIRNNIFLFIPFGMIISRVRPKWSSILNVLQVSAGIEILQFITGSGVCELDDIFSNMLGGTIGLTLGLLLSFGSDWLFTQIRGMIRN